MFTKMLKKDIVKNKGINITLLLFIILAATLVAGAFSIIAETIGSMNTFLDKSKPLHYMQQGITSHVDQSEIDKFSKSNDLVDQQQTLEMLGIDNNYIYYGDNPEPYSNSVMENLFTTQSPKFDFLLDENNKIIKVNPGEIAAPLYAIDNYGLKAGDNIYIKYGDFEMEFVVKCFARDSQMNASLVSSKRFLVNESDYEILKANVGEVEYIIEFLLTDASKTSEFSAAYNHAGLPVGIEITLPIIKMMNAMTSGLPALALIMASLLLILIAMLCLRFTIMTTLEEEYREIGVMKAIGVKPKLIAKLYRSKYIMISAAACFAGFLLALVLSSLFTESVSLYMGKSDSGILKFFLPLAGAALVFAIITNYCSRVMKKLRGISVVDAIRGTFAVSNAKKLFPVHKFKIDTNLTLGLRDVVNRLRDYKMPILVFIMCAFLVIVPTNFLNTLKDPSFIGYTGIGECDAIITLRYTGDIEQRFSAVMNALKNDGDVSLYSERITASYKTINPDNELISIGIQNGDFTKFAVPYLSGKPPVAENEIALSLLNSKELDAKVGDTVKIIDGNKTYLLTVSGIYQDITNGGKSAQAHIEYKQENVLWYSVYVNFNAVDAAAKIDKYNKLFAPAKVTGVEDYMSQTLNSTINQFESVTVVVSIISIIVAILITVLFIKMLLSKDKGQITIMKGLGFNSKHIKKQYISAMILCLITGVTIGVVLALTLGESFIGLLMSALGASKISFVIEPIMSFIVCPLSLLISITITTLLSSKAIKKFGNYIIGE